jgi:tripartite-type tricarboxylate transporter receptor subunit TctC
MTKLTRRTFALGAAAAPLIARSAYAQNLPTGTIRIVVPYPPAGSTDAMMRMIQPSLQQRLGATIIIENKPGASGSIGTAQVAKAPPDGASWVIVFDNHAANPFVLPSVPFNTEKDLDPVLLIGTAPYMVTTNPNKPYRNLADVIAAAKAQPDKVSYGSVGAGSIGHLAMTLLSNRAGIKLVHVPYRGGGPAMNDTIAGHVEMLIGSTALQIPQVVGGKVRPIFHTGNKRLTSQPDVSTVMESGFPGFEAYAWWGVFAPAGTPKPMIDKFGAEMAACLREERVSKQLIETQQVDLRLAGPEELRKFLSEQIATWGKVVRENNIKGDG